MVRLSLPQETLGVGVFEIVSAFSVSDVKNI